MRTLILLLSILTLVSCQQKEDYYQKADLVLANTRIGTPGAPTATDIAQPGPLVESPQDITPPVTQPVVPVDSCEEMSSFMLCKSSPGCEPVLESNASNISSGKEESNFSHCISMPAPVQPVIEIPVVTEPVPVVTEPVPVVTEPVIENPVVTDPVVVTPPAVDPEATIPTDCAQIDKSKIQVKDGVKKVLICHSANSKKHSILISCSALAKHVAHHDDSLGLCVNE